MSHSQASYGTAQTGLLEPLVSVHDAALLLGVSGRTVRRLIETRELTPVRIGSRVLLEPEMIRAYRERHREGGP